MGIPYRARVNERWFLNLPGFHGGAYVVAYVEDTSECGLRRDPYCDGDCSDCPYKWSRCRGGDARRPRAVSSAAEQEA